jgi:hypothetical protein
MATININDSYQDIARDSNMISNLFVDLTNLYKGLKALPLKILVTILAICITPFLGVFLLIVLEYFYRKIKNKINTKEISLGSKDEYLSLRNSYNILSNSLIVLENLKQTKTGEEIEVSRTLYFFSRIFLFRLIDIFQMILPYTLKLKETLDNFDKKSPKGKIFTLVSEQELWKNRTKSYEYLV